MKNPHFVPICIAVSAMSLLAACNSGVTGEKTTLQSAGLEAIKVTGELGERISRNFDRMESEVYHPEQVYWTEEESNGWPGDKEGRTILALVLDAQAAHRTPKYLDQIISMLPSRLNAKGYLGAIYEGKADEQQLSGHGWLLRGLCEYYEWKKDEKVLDMARTIADSLFVPITQLVDNYPLEDGKRIEDVGEMAGTLQNEVNGWRLSSDIGCVFIGMDGLIQTYQYAPSEKSKALIDKLIALFRRMDFVGLKAQTHSTATAMRGLLRYYNITGDTSLLSDVEKCWRLYKDYGMTENYENYNWFRRYDTWTEPCAILDSYMVAMQLWAITRKGQYLEDADRIYYNGIAATQRHNGGFGCDLPVGAVYPGIGVFADEATWCCTMRGGEGLSKAAEYSYFIHGDRILIPAYHESILDMPEKSIKITQHTSYPFGNTVTLEINNAPPKGVDIEIFKPSYMYDVKATVSGEPLAGAANNAGMFAFDRRFAVGDVIKVSFGFEAGWTALENRDIKDKSLYKAMYGPLVLGYDSETMLSLPEKVPFRPAGAASFTLDYGDAGGGEHLLFSPLYHLLDGNVSSHAGYHKEVVVKIAE